MLIQTISQVKKERNGNIRHRYGYFTRIVIREKGTVSVRGESKLLETTCIVSINELNDVSSSRNDVDQDQACT